MGNSKWARGQFILLRKHLCSDWLLLLQMMHRLVCCKCHYNVRNELTKEAFCIIGQGAPFADRFLPTYSNFGWKVDFLRLVLQFPWSVHDCLHMTVQLSNWSHRQNSVVPNRTPVHGPCHCEGPFSGCTAGSFITKRISYGTSIYIIRLLDIQMRLRDYCVALESHTGALSNQPTFLQCHWFLLLPNCEGDWFQLGRSKNQLEKWTSEHTWGRLSRLRLASEKVYTGISWLY